MNTCTHSRTCATVLFLLNNTLQRKFYLERIFNTVLAMKHIAWVFSDFPRNTVIGAGTETGRAGLEVCRSEQDLLNSCGCRFNLCRAGADKNFNPRRTLVCTQSATNCVRITTWNIARSKFAWTPDELILCVKWNDALRKIYIRGLLFNAIHEVACCDTKMLTHVWNCWACFSFDAYFRTTLCLIAATVDERASHKRKVANGIVSYDHQNPESFFSCEIDLSWI